MNPPDAKIGKLRSGILPPTLDKTQTVSACLQSESAS